MSSNPMNRRDLLRAGVASTLSASFLTTPLLNGTAQALQATGEAKDPWHGLKIGVASYSLRKLSLDDTIKGIRRVGLKYVSIKDFHLPLNSTPDERRQVTQKFKSAGITPLSCGVIGLPNNEEAIRKAFEYARDAGIPVIVGSPEPAALPILDRLVKEFDLRVAIHNHGPEDKHWPSPYDVIKGIMPFDSRIGICMDIGHTVRTGVDPAEAIRKLRDRIYDVHIKDLDSSAPNGKNVEVGRGVIDIPAVMQALIEIKFAGHAGFEYEKDADDPMPGLSESVGYTRGVLARRTV